MPPLRFDHDGGLHTYRVHRPSRGRDVIPTARPNTASPHAEVETAQSAWAAAVTPPTTPASDRAEPRARPVVAPIYPLARAHGSEQYLPAMPAPPQPVAVAPVEVAEAATRTRSTGPTDIIALRAWTSTGLRPEPSTRRLGLGWWIALGCAAAFFASSAALWLF